MRTSQICVSNIWLVLWYNLLRYLAKAQIFMV